MIKKKLIDDALAIDAKETKLKTMKEKLRRYLKKAGEDSQVKDVLTILKIFGKEPDNFEEVVKIAAPIIERLNSTDEWDYCDTRIAATVICYTDTPEQAIMLTENALKRLKKFEERHDIVELSVYANILCRLVRVKHDNTPFKKLETTFSEYVDQALAKCEKSMHFEYKAIILIRKGLFLKNHKDIEQGFKILKENEEYELYNTMQVEAAEYNFFIESSMSKKQYNAIIGSNIRKERIARNLSIDDLSKILGITTGAIGMIELGYRGATSYNLYRLADLFDISMDVFLDGIKEASPADKNKNNKIDTLITFTKSLTPSELNHVIITAKNIKGLGGYRENT